MLSRDEISERVCYIECCTSFSKAFFQGFWELLSHICVHLLYMLKSSWEFVRKRKGLKKRWKGKQQPRENGIPRESHKIWGKTTSGGWACCIQTEASRLNTRKCSYLTNLKRRVSYKTWNEAGRMKTRQDEWRDRQVDWGQRRWQHVKRHGFNCPSLGSWPACIWVSIYRLIKQSFNFNSVQFATSCLI